MDLENYFYKFYGLNISSDYQFSSLQSTSSTHIDLNFRCIVQDRLPAEMIKQAPNLSWFVSNDPEIKGHLFRYHNSDIFHIENQIDFIIKTKQIEAYVTETSKKYYVDIFFAGVILGYWFEKSGIPALHSGAVAVNEKAVAFMADSHGGKSCLTAIFLQQGFSMITDDLLIVESSDVGYLCRAGFPQMRMWPEQADHFIGGYVDFNKVHPDFSKRRVPVGGTGFGSFYNKCAPLTCIYLPERRLSDPDLTDINISQVPPNEALMELVRNSFFSLIIDALGWQSERLKLFAKLVEEIPVRRISYPSGFEHLPRVRDTILEDLSRL